MRRKGERKEDEKKEGKKNKGGDDKDDPRVPSSSKKVLRFYWYKTYIAIHILYCFFGHTQVFIMGLFMVFTLSFLTTR